MSRWGSWYPPSSPKKPPPAHGIKMKQAGTTWWGQRWIAALEQMSSDYGSRLQRGRSYARAGRTHDLEVQAGRVTARVTGSRPTPYKVTIQLTPLDEARWQRAIAVLAAKAQFAAALLAGEMPRDIDEAFGAAGASLFPARASDLRTDCSCPDVANPCKHIAATHYVLGEALDKDPFLLFELRGRTRGEVLAALRAARGGAAPSVADRPEAELAPPPPVAKLGRISEAAYETWRTPPPTLHLALARPQAPGALLRQLGAPRGWTESASPAELLEPVVRAAAERALAMAFAGTEEDPAEPAPAPPEKPRRGPARRARR